MFHDYNIEDTVALKAKMVHKEIKSFNNSKKVLDKRVYYRPVLSNYVLLAS